MHRVYQTSACDTFADVPLAKASYMAKVRVHMGRDYTRPWVIGGTLPWRPCLEQSTTITWHTWDTNAQEM